MSLQENIRNIIFYYIKQKYCSLIKVEKKQVLESEEIIEMVEKLYLSEKSKLQQYIRIV